MHAFVISQTSSGTVCLSIIQMEKLILAHQIKICYTPANFVCGGYTVFTLSLRASVCVCVHVCVRPSCP